MKEQDMKPPHADFLQKRFPFLAGCIGVLAFVLVGGSAAGQTSSGSHRAVSFSGPHTYRAGGAGSVAVGDLNGDRRLDVAVTSGRSKVSVLLNHGHGRFPTKRAYQVGRTPVSVAIGDVNGDRKPDLAVANLGAWTVSVLLNRGGGRYGPKQDYATGQEPLEVVIRDLNGDGKPDLATANFGDENSDDPKPTISVLLGSGDGRFDTRVDYPAPERPWGIAAGDLNGDGRADVAVAEGGEVSVFLNVGGGFEAPRTYRGYGYEVAIADMNRDGKQDLVTGGISVLLNRGDGSFGRRTYDMGGYVQGLAVGDLNRDGRPDVVVAEAAGPDDEDCDTGTGILVYVLANKGHGKLGRPVDFSTDYNCFPIPALGDVSGDGLRDIVTANTYSGTVSILVNAFGRCAVPYLDYNALRYFKAKLFRSGCRVGRIRYAYSRFPRGVVLSESPAWGAVLRKGAKVNLVVSLGPRR
jgi:hypothetical protein